MTLMSNMSEICTMLNLPVGTAVADDEEGDHKKAKRERKRKRGNEGSNSTHDGAVAGGDESSEQDGASSNTAMLTAAAVGVGVGLVAAGVAYRRVRRSSLNGRGRRYEAVPSEPI